MESGRPAPEPQPAPRRRRRALLGAAALVFLALVALDLSRPPERQTSARLALVGIAAYQQTLSPLLAGIGVRCRFEPTCSRYGAAVIRDHGAWGGLWRAAWRVLRCGPWTEAGTVDPPPERRQESQRPAFPADRYGSRKLPRGALRSRA